MKIITWIKQNKLLVLLVFIGAILRLYKLDFQSPWIDEIFTLYNCSSEKSFKEIYIFLKQSDPHPPLYYFIVHFFYLIFENTSFVARAVSAIFGIAGLFSIYYLAKELLNKKVGLIAVALLAVNYFHIYHSQEARMYGMLFFTTTMSFLYLIKFIKKPSYKSAILHAVFAALMIYTHFFALFALFAQYLILLYFIIKPFNESSKRVLILSIVSGLTTLILYIPALFILLQTSERTSIWITIPERDVYTVMIKEFFGFSETVLFIAFIAISFFMFKLFGRREIKKYNIDPVKEKQVFTFFIIFIWIFVTLFIPLIISYINLPMIVNRYFINVLPALIILIAAGIYYVKNNTVKVSLIVLFVVFSLSDVIIVKNYYSFATKTQFRELTNEIIEQNTDKADVVTYWSWLIPYFFDSSTGIHVHPNTFQEYVNGIKNGSIEKKSFWYLDGHFRPFDLSVQDQDYLNEHFTLKKKLEYLDCWANYYESKSVKSKDEFSLKSFKAKDLDGDGNILLFENTILKSDLIFLDKGEYEMNFKGISLPQQPINGENAHIVIKINATVLADFYLDKNALDNIKSVKFPVTLSKKYRFQIIYDNDIFIDSKDRNVILKSIDIKKLE